MIGLMAVDHRICRGKVENESFLPKIGGSIWLIEGGINLGIFIIPGTWISGSCIGMGSSKIADDGNWGIGGKVRLVGGEIKWGDPGMQDEIGHLLPFLA